MPQKQVGQPPLPTAHLAAFVWVQSSRPSLRASESGQVIDYRKWQVPLGRRFRALKLWFAFKLMGTEGLQRHVRRSFALAERFERWVAADDRFDMPTPRLFGLVCLRLKGQPNDAQCALLDGVNGCGFFLVSTKVDDQVVIRVAVGSPQCEAQDIDELWRAFQREADKLVGPSK
mmetsp:Transcript_3684/g.9175  ORF Transcript_3684/g.9175 Transcript_3684/m.9175 type:complete len:174 (+) Transcript_3684:187-708(+)